MTLKKPNVEFLMKMTKSYLDGELDSVSYSLDFPYEVETRYKKLLKEDRTLAEIIYDCLVEEGVNLYQDLSEKEFREKIRKEHDFKIKYTKLMARHLNIYLLVLCLCASWIPSNKTLG